MQNVMVIKTSKRRDAADSIQKTLTEFGCIIKARIGLHEAGDFCSDEGLILLQLLSDNDEVKKLEKTLGDLDGVEFKLVQI